MSKSVRRNTKDLKEGTLFSVKDSAEKLSTYSTKHKEDLESVLKYFLVSVSILLSTNIYILKTVIKA
jgi:hypothetical protein